MMMSLGEAITLYTAIVGVVGYVILFLVVLIFSRRTATYIYIMDMAVTMIIHFFVNPSFHIFYISPTYDSDIDVSQVLYLLNFILFCGMLAILVLLLLMDYFRWIANFKWIVILVQFITTIVLTSTYFLMIDYMEYFLHTTVFWILAEFFSFVLLYLIQDDVKVLQKRRVIDDESHLRRSIINTFLRTKALAGIVFALESIIELLFYTTPTFGSCALGVTQIDSTLFIIILFKLDPNLRTNFVKGFKMFLCKRSEQTPDDVIDE